MELSVVIPVYNEEENIKPLIEKLNSALQGIEYELIFVDDGSADNTSKRIRQLFITFAAPIRLIQFTRNYGQTSALAAGIDAAHGEYIATLDGDLQNDPSDIPLLLNKLKQETLDIVTGIRAHRKDHMLSRNLPSKIANWLIGKTTGIPITDYGCTLKVFRSQTAKNLDLSGELHRFIPILGHMAGAKIAQLEVKHHPRIHGTSKYGLSRTFRVASDLVYMLFLLRFRQKPMHLFGGLGIIMFLCGSIVEIYLLLLKILGHDIGGRPLFYIGILLLITGIQLITTGFLAELLMRTYTNTQAKKPYTIKENTHNHGEKNGA